SLLQVRAWVIDLLVADFAVNLEHAVVVCKHVACNWVGERVLGVGINVHLDDAVAQRFFDLFLLRAGATVEDEVEGVRASRQTKLLLGNLLTHVQNFWAQLHVAWLVYAVDVAESRCQQVASVLAGSQRVDSLSKVFFGGIEARASFGFNAVFFAADDTDFNLEHDVRRLSLSKQFLSDLHVCIDTHCGTVPHARQEQRQLASVNALLRNRDERTDVLIKYFFLAVVSVQCNVDAVVLCGLVSKCRQSLRAGNLILHTQTGTKLSATGRKLDDAIG